MDDFKQKRHNTSAVAIELRLFCIKSLKVDYLIICIICDTDSVNKLTFQMYTLHKYK